MLMIFAVFVQPLKSISYWMCFHNCGRLWNHLHCLTGITIFAPVGPLSSWQHQGWVELNRLSRCSESTSMKSRNDFNLYRVDLYRNDRTPKTGTKLLFTDLLFSFIYQCWTTDWGKNRKIHHPPITSNSEMLPQIAPAGYFSLSRKGKILGGEAQW